MRNYLKELREKAGLSQQIVADQLGIAQNYYCMIENGERQPKMSIELAQKLAKIFDVSIEYIIEQENKTAQAKE